MYYVQFTSMCQCSLQLVCAYKWIDGNANALNPFHDKTGFPSTQKAWLSYLLIFADIVAPKTVSARNKTTT